MAMLYVKRFCGIMRFVRSDSEAFPI
jgi:hypothetical protein